MKSPEASQLLDTLPNSVQLQILHNVADAQGIEFHDIDLAPLDQAPDDTPPCEVCEASELDAETVMRDYPQCRHWFEPRRCVSSMGASTKEPDHVLPC